jgi:hypothetical protein
VVVVVVVVVVVPAVFFRASLLQGLELENWKPTLVYNSSNAPISCVASPGRANKCHVYEKRTSMDSSQVPIRPSRHVQMSVSPTGFRAAASIHLALPASCWLLGELLGNRGLHDPSWLDAICSQIVFASFSPTRDASAHVACSGLRIRSKQLIIMYS